MAGKLPSMGDYVLPPEILDLHEWMADSYIDGATGSDCLLVYPDKWTQCDNCLFDMATQRSSNIYKLNGPMNFPANSLCPRCNGAGRSQVPVTEIIRMRVYWERKSWIDIGMKIAQPDGVAMCVGYMDDLMKLEKANKVVLNSELSNIRKYECVREGEARPYGYRRNRYFIQYMRRTGGG